jgi:hypothetical protein
MKIEVNNAVFSLPYHVAKEKGLFRDEGLDVELIPGGARRGIRWNCRCRRPLAAATRCARLRDLFFEPLSPSRHRPNEACDDDARDTK